VTISLPLGLNSVGVCPPLARGLEQIKIPKDVLVYEQERMNGQETYKILRNKFLYYKLTYDITFIL